MGNPAVRDSARFHEALCTADDRAIRHLPAMGERSAIEALLLDYQSWLRSQPLLTIQPTVRPPGCHVGEGQRGQVASAIGVTMVAPVTLPESRVGSHSTPRMC